MSKYFVPDHSIQDTLDHFACRLLALFNAGWHSRCHRQWLSGKCIAKGDLSVLGPINAYKSVVGIIVGIFLLGEVPTAWGLAGTGLIIWGSYFVLETTADRFSWALLKQKAIQYRIWALILTAIEAVFIKRVIQVSDVNMAFVSWCWFGTLFSMMLLPLYKVQLTPLNTRLKTHHLLHYGYLVLCIGIMQLATNYAFSHMPVGYALALFQLSAIVSVWMGYRFFQEQDLYRKLLGALIMVIGSILIILLK